MTGRVFAKHGRVRRERQVVLEGLVGYDKLMVEDPRRGLCDQDSQGVKKPRSRSSRRRRGYNRGAATTTVSTGLGGHKGRIVYVSSTKPKGRFVTEKSFGRHRAFAYIRGKSPLRVTDDPRLTSRFASVIFRQRGTLWSLHGPIVTAGLLMQLRKGSDRQEDFKNPDDRSLFRRRQR